MSLRFFLAFFAAAIFLISLAHADTREEAWVEMNKHTVELVKAGKYDLAFENAQKVVAQARVQFGLTHLNTAKAMNNLANLYASRGNFPAAQDLYEKVLKIETARLGQEAPGLADTLFNLAKIHLVTKEPSRAKPLLEQALRIKEREGASASPMVKNIQELLAAQTK